MLIFRNKEYSDEELQNLVNESTSISEILKKIGISHVGGNHTKLKKYLTENNFDVKTLVGRKIKRFSDKGIPKKKLSELLTENSTGNSNYLKNRLINEGVKGWKCEKCGNSEYDGDIIPLELHHINGNHYDNRINNLIILCPICHNRTTNFRGKNKQYDKILSDIANQNSRGVIEKLIEKENLESKIYHLRKIERGEIPLTNRKKSEKRFCQYCGKEITNKGAKKYCSYECSHANSRKNVYNKDILLEQSKQVKSMMEFAKIYNISDNALRKILSKYNILDICKKNFMKKT